MAPSIGQPDIICTSFPDKKSEQHHLNRESVKKNFDVNILTTNTQFTQSKNYLNCDLEDVPVYTGHSLFNTIKHITLLFIV